MVAELRDPHYGFPMKLDDHTPIAIILYAIYRR